MNSAKPLLNHHNISTLRRAALEELLDNAGHWWGEPELEAKEEQLSLVATTYSSK